MTGSQTSAHAKTLLLCEGWQGTYTVDQEGRLVQLAEAEAGDHQVWYPEVVYVEQGDKVWVARGDLGESALDGKTAVSSLDEMELEERTLADGDRVKMPKGGRWVVEGPAQRSDVKNANQRVYPRAIWEKLIADETSYVQKAIKSRSMVGHLEHPKDGRTDGKAGALLTTKAELREDGTVWGQFEILDTPDGRILQEYTRKNVRWGVSSRGNGSVDATGKVDEDNYHFKVWDAVMAPSTPGAFPGVKEAPEGEVVVEGVELKAEKSGHGSTYRMTIGGKVGPTAITGTVRQVSIGIDEITPDLVRKSVTVNRADGSGKKIPSGVQRAVETAVLAKLKTLKEDLDEGSLYKRHKAAFDAAKRRFDAEHLPQHSSGDAIAFAVPKGDVKDFSAHLKSFGLKVQKQRQGRPKVGSSPATDVVTVVESEDGQLVHLEEAKPVGRAQIALLAALRAHENYTRTAPTPNNRMALTDFARGPAFRGLHFAKIMSAAKSLSKKGLLGYDEQAGQVWSPEAKEGVDEASKVPDSVSVDEAIEDALQTDETADALDAAEEMIDTLQEQVSDSQQESGDLRRRLEVAESALDETVEQLSAVRGELAKVIRERDLANELLAEAPARAQSRRVREIVEVAIGETPQLERHRDLLDEATSVEQAESLIAGFRSVTPAPRPDPKPKRRPVPRLSVPVGAVLESTEAVDPRRHTDAPSEGAQRAAAVLEAMSRPR